MSAQPRDTHPSVPMVDLEIDGHPVSAPKGSMIITACDAAGIPLPRFCYHKKLPIAAVCRQCMVEVEMGGKAMPKPQVACATPVAAGMKVFTQSPRAIHAQQNALEFVLINHPLDCPICDQGGECELQDLTMGFGRGISRFTERKRTISDENVGPLVATEMTRCIHCTRCVRFLGEVAGSYEFGDFDRGDRHVVGTWIGRGIGSELSGNVIDVCPVGALTDKVFQFKARAWELIARPSIGYHDALGSNLWLHTKRGQVLRSVPRDNEAINECWLSDRDRYSHEGLYAQDRALKPLVRKGGELVEVEWDEALEFVAAGLRQAGSDVAALVAPLASCEEGFLLGALLRGLGSQRIDHRLRVQDFRDGGPAGAPFEMSVEDIAGVRAALLIGSFTRFEMPLLNQRLRRATRRDISRPHVANIANYDIADIDAGSVYAINPAAFDFHFDLAGEKVFAPQDLVDGLLRAAKAAGAESADGALSDAIAAADDHADARAWMQALKDASTSVVILGDAATQHPQAAWLRALARAIARATGSAYDELPSGANAVGLARAGAQANTPDGHARAILEHPPKALVTWQVEAQDLYAPALYAGARERAEFHVHAGAYADEDVRRTADAVLPLGLPPEIDGSYVNADGFVQAVAAGATLAGDARAGWKVLRVLGATLGIAGFDFVDVKGLRDAMGSMTNAAAGHTAEPGSGLRRQDAGTNIGEADGPQGEPRERRVSRDPGAEGQTAAGGAPRSESRPSTGSEGADGLLVRLATVGIYRSDAVVRRAKGLQKHPLNRPAEVRVGADDAQALGLADGAQADVHGVHLPVVVDPAVPRGCAWIEAGHAETAALPPYGAALQIKAVRV